MQALVQSLHMFDHIDVTYHWNSKLEHVFTIIHRHTLLFIQGQQEEHSMLCGFHQGC